MGSFHDTIVRLVKVTPTKWPAPSPSTGNLDTKMASFDLHFPRYTTNLAFALETIITEAGGVMDMDKQSFLEWIDFQENRFHPLVWINGDPHIGNDVYIGFFSVINAKDSEIYIGAECDIAPLVSINCADSHKKCLELSDEVKRSRIELENNVFVGTQSVIKPGTTIGHHSAVGAGEVVSGTIPPYSLIVDGKVKERYYEDEFINGGA